MRYYSNKRGNLFGKIAVTLAILLSLGASSVAIGMGVKHNGWFEKAECEHVYVDGVCEECGEKEVVEDENDESPADDKAAE